MPVTARTLLQKLQYLPRSRGAIQGQHQHPCGRELLAAALIDQIHQTRRIDVCLRVELHVEHRMPAVDRFDPQLLGGRFQAGIFQQVAHRIGHRALAVFQFLLYALALGRRAGVGDLAVGAQALVFFGDVLRPSARGQFSPAGAHKCRSPRR
jgi:hypothetical protein